MRVLRIRFVGRGLTAWSRTRKPIVAAITVIMDWASHDGLGSIGLNHVKKAGIAMKVKLACKPPRNAKYEASRLMVRVGMKVFMRNSDIASGVVRLVYVGMDTVIAVQNRLMRSRIRMGLCLVMVLVR